jgi:hypothetical protein
MLPSRLRLVPVLLVVSLIVLGSSSAAIRKTHAVPWIDLRSRENNNATTNKGTITLWSTTYSLPNGREALTTNFQIAYTPAPGYKFVKWEGEGGVTFDNANSQTTQAHISDVGEYTIRAVYEVGGSSVGGILLPANSFVVLARYLALIGLVATAAAVAVKKRRN